MKYLAYIILGLLMSPAVHIYSQQDSVEKNEDIFTVYLDGERYDAIIENGDTIIFADLNDVQVTAQPEFKNDDQLRRYLLYKKYAGIVYPYAVKAVRIFRETEYVTENMGRKNRKKHIKKLEKRLENEFEEPLKKLTKIQGMMLTKMIEKELETPMYDLIAGLRGRWTATYYSTIGLMYNYNLRRGYKEGDDWILDIILKDFEIDYNLKEEIKKNKEEQERIITPDIPVIPEADNRK